MRPTLTPPPPGQPQLAATSAARGTPPTSGARAFLNRAGRLCGAGIARCRASARSAPAAGPLRAKWPQPWPTHALRGPATLASLLWRRRRARSSGGQSSPRSRPRRHRPQ